MMLPKIFEKFVNGSPVSVMLQGVMSMRCPRKKSINCSPIQRNNNTRGNLRPLPSWT